MGLRLSPEKTCITHIDEGLDFLGWRIQRHRKRGTTRCYVYTYPAKKALRAVMAKVKAVCRNLDPAQSDPARMVCPLPTVACQRDGTTALPRPRDHLGVDVMVIG